MRRLVLCGVWLLLAAPASAETSVVTAEDGGARATFTAEPSRVALGEPVTLTLEVSEPADGRIVSAVDLAALVRASLGADIAEVRGVDRGEGRITATLHVYDAGSFELPAVDLEIAVGDAPARIVRLAGLSVDVGEVIEDGAPPHVERGALALPGDPLLWPWLLLWGALLLALGLVVWSRRRSLRPLPPPPPPAPPHSRALAALDSLLADRLPESGRVEPFFVRLSEIARHYVEGRFGVRAPEQTTEEFLVELGTGVTGGLGPQRGLLRSFLERADLVKFARDVPDVGTCRAAADDVRRLVVTTAPTTQTATSSASEAVA